MARTEKDAKGRAGRKSRTLDLVRSNEGSGDKIDLKDRYHISASCSTRSDDSSHARGSENASELSRESTDDESSVGSSFETESDLSSLLELGPDGGEILEHGGIFSIRSYESKPSVVGGWFDFACGWMDRPNMCVTLGGSKQTSLLQESSLKAAKAMRRVKLNETIKKASDSEAATQDKKKRSDVEKIERDVAKAAMVAAATIKMHEIQPGVPSARLVQTQQEKRIEPPTGRLVQNQPEKKSETNKPPTKSDGHTNEDIEAKMKQVSARAAEILKNTIEARAVKSKEERDRSPSLKYSSSVHLRQKVIDKLTQEHGDFSSNEGNEKNMELVQIPSSNTKVPNATNKEEPSDPSTRSTRSTRSVVVVEENVTHAVKGEIVHLEDKSEVVVEAEENTDVRSVDVVTGSQHPLSEDTTTTVSLDVGKYSGLEQSVVVAASHSITDLTHFDDGHPDEEDDPNGNEDDDSCEKSPLPISARVRTDPPPNIQPVQVAMHQDDIKKKEVEVINVLELDDTDSWSPVEASEPIVGVSRPLGLQDPIFDRASGNRSPSKSNRASLFEANVRNVEGGQSHEWKTKDSLAARLEQRRAEKAKQNEVFNDPNARETFAGLRRGRLEIKDMVRDRSSRSKSSSRRRHELVESLQPSPSSQQRFHHEGTDSTEFASDARTPSDIIASEVALRRARSRESRQLNDKSIELRRRVVEATTTESVNGENWPTDSSTVRSRHLVAVRSIDEAQRLKTERQRDVNEPNIYKSRSRDKLDYIPYAYRLTGRPDTAPDVPDFHGSRMRHHEVSPRAEQSFHHRYEPRPNTQPTYDREQDYLESRPSLDRREQEMYSSAIINRSKSRESHHDYSDDRNLHHRSQDTRDDTDSPYNVSRRDPSGHNRYDQFSESRSRHRERSSHPIESDHMKELRKLEKKISKQLKHVSKDKYNSEDGGWDEHSEVSAKQLRHLESTLVQTLRTEDEKRAAKLQRIRSKKTSTTKVRSMEGGMDGSSRYDSRSELLSHNRSLSPEKDMDIHDSRSKYNQLKFLRQSGQMRKYMQRSSSRPEGY